MSNQNEADVIDAARDLVALWHTQKIEGASRADRNAAIQGVRERLTSAVGRLDDSAGREFSDAAELRITELEQICAELYQVIGSLSDHAGLFDHPDVIRALDQASQARSVHDDLLPWPRNALTK